MADPSSIRAGMTVLGSDGERVGTVDGVEGGNTIKLKRVDSPDGQHHHVPLSQVSSVDGNDVRLNQAASAVRAGWGTAGTGAATMATAGAHGATQVHVEDKKDGAAWLPWLLGALALLALLIFGLRSCDEQGSVQKTRTETPAGVEQTTTVRDGDGDVLARETVLLPNRQQVQLAPQGVNYQLQRYLAGNETAPRTFRFDRVHFPTNSAEVIPAERGDISDMARVLAAYPNARVRLVGYADARGDAAANQRLGAQRADAIKALLVGQGVQANRIEAATGGEATPTDTNATAGGQAENRRTELVVLSR